MVPTSEEWGGFFKANVCTTDGESVGSPTPSLLPLYPHPPRISILCLNQHGCNYDDLTCETWLWSKVKLKQINGDSSMSVDESVRRWGAATLNGHNKTAHQKQPLLIVEKMPSNSHISWHLISTSTTTISFRIEILFTHLYYNCLFFIRLLIFFYFSIFERNLSTFLYFTCS